MMSSCMGSHTIQERLFKLRSGRTKKLHVCEENTSHTVTSAAGQNVNSTQDGFMLFMQNSAHMDSTAQLQNSGEEAAFLSLFHL